MLKLYNCSKCSKTFNNKRNYTRHINKKNLCYKKLECIKCKKIFNKKNNYSRHIKMKISCTLKNHKKINKNAQLQLVLVNKDNLILKKDNEILRRDVKELKKENEFMRMLLKKNNIDNSYSNINYSTINSNNVTLNIHLHLGHITKEMLDLKEKEAIKKIKNGTSTLPTYDKQLEMYYSEEERICAQYLMELVHFIWNHPELPENKIIKYFEDRYLKYCELGKWGKHNISQIQDYILETIYVTCKKKELVKNRLNSILKHCKIHPKYEQTKMFGNKTFLNIIQKCIKKVIKIL